LATYLDDFSNNSDILSKIESLDPKVRDTELGHCFFELHAVLQEYAIETNQLSKDENEKFNHTLKDYIRYMDSVKQIINNRDNALLQWQNNVTDLESKKEKLVNNEDNQKKISLVQQAEEAVETSKKEYEILNEAVKRELINFQKIKKLEITQAIKYLVHLNMEHHMKIGNLWKGLFVALESKEFSQL